MYSKQEYHKYKKMINSHLYIQKKMQNILSNIWEGEMVQRNTIMCRNDQPLQDCQDYQNHHIRRDMQDTQDHQMCLDHNTRHDHHISQHHLHQKDKHRN